MHEELLRLKEEALKDIAEAEELKSLQDIRVRYLGKKGLVTEKLKGIAGLSKQERPEFGRVLNEIKALIESSISRKEDILKAADKQRMLRSEAVDISLPGYFTTIGREHPISKILSEITQVFTSLGFTVEEGPEVESDYYNFEALNIPKDHPARDMQDTFYISDDILLRTHTSPVQVRVMERQRPPLRVIAPGKVYRCDSDITHTPMFHQVEGFMVDTDIRFSDLKGILELFIHAMFGPETSIRFRPSFFPFTEPSAEIDIGCVLCFGAGCKVCKDTGWLEILGAGMINPRVFEMVHYDPEIYTGFAFGMGVERITMLKYGIDDIRLFFENDIRFLEQF